MYGVFVDLTEKKRQRSREEEDAAKEVEEYTTTIDGDQSKKTKETNKKNDVDYRNHTYIH